MLHRSLAQPTCFQAGKHLAPVNTNIWCYTPQYVHHTLHNQTCGMHIVCLNSSIAETQSNDTNSSPCSAWYRVGGLPFFHKPFQVLRKQQTSATSRISTHVTAV